PPVIGLIGGIGSGKSSVAELFAQRGGRIVSGDLAGHEALRDPEIRDRIVGRWGKDLLDERGETSRRKLAAIVFANPREREALEAIVFPWIKNRLREQIVEASLDRQVAFVILDAAVMLEAGWSDVCDWIVYVHVSRELRLKRIAKQR